MFIDRVKLTIQAGDGGDGMIAFHREKFVDKGGPSGGDGGRGGSIYFLADSGLTTLLDFQYRHTIEAPNGGKGMGKNMYGASGDDIILKVPVGTVVFDNKNQRVVADFKTPGQKELIAKGGRGGRGNAKFATSTNQVPRVAENGAPGERIEAILELKLLADVGLVGFPSVGKSSLLAAVSSARPQIADYHFTTLVPNLGVVSTPDQRSFVMADLPGLIEGAHQGKGLGLQFLRHIERCRVLVHVIDMASVEGRDPFQDFTIIQSELKQYGMRLDERPMIIAANKMDDDAAWLILEEFKAKIDPKFEIFPISALARTGLTPLLYRIADLLAVTPAFPMVSDEQISKIVLYETKLDERGFQVRQIENHKWLIFGERIERLYRMTNISTDEGLLYLTSILRKMGVEEELRNKGVQEGDIVRLVDFEFEYFD